MGEENAARLKAILDHLPLGLAYMGGDGRLVLANDAFYRSFDFPTDWGPGTDDDRFTRHILHRTTDLSGDALEAAVAARLARLTRECKGGALSRDVERLDDGRVIEIRRRAAPQGDLVTTYLDITEPARSAAAARAAAQRFEAVVEDQTEMICRYDADYRLTFVNNAYCAAFGKTREALIGSVFLDLIVEPKPREALRNGLAKLTPNRPILRGTYPERAPDGATCWQSWINRALFDEQGDLLEYQAVGRDVTAERRMHEALARSERHLRNIVDAHPVPVVIVDDETGRITYASDKAVALFRPKRGSLDGLTGLDVIGDAAEHRRCAQMLRSKGRLDEEEIEVVTEDGGRMPIQFTARIIDFEGRRVVVCGLLDITERKAAEAQIARQREALGQSEKMTAMGSLLASVSHELNNPLSIIVGQSQLLESLAEDPKVADRAGRIRAAADRCARIVRAFLAMARQKPAERRPAALNALVQDAIEMARYAFDSGGVALDVTLDPTEPAILGDADQLTQVAVNLLINAQQALSEQPGARRVALSTRLEGDRARIIVEDNGPGVPEELQARIFEPFFTTKPEGVGTGVGLAVCRNLVAGHEGDLSLAQSPLGGARFLIDLPAWRETADGAPAKPELADRWRALPPLSVLIVDDELQIAETARDILAADGHAIHLAANGAEALDLLDREEIDVIVSDLRMPTLDGPGLWRAIEAAGVHPVARVGFFTGDSLSAAARRFLEESQARMIEKPFEADDLRWLILELLDQEV